MATKSPKRTTIKDVADDAGVSIKTVSRVINKESSIKDATLKKVEASIRRLKYKPNMAARGLAGSHSFKLALLYDHTQDHVNFNYIIHLQNGVLDCCRSEGYDLLIHPCNFRSPELHKELVETAKSARLSGIILMPPLSDNKKLIRHLDKSGIKFVTMASVHKPLSVGNVISSDEEASYLMTQHLITMGHNAIALIQGHPDHGASALRQQGFERAVQEAGLIVPSDYVVQGYFDFESGRAAAASLLSLKKPPQAIFCSNDEMAAGVIHEAMKRDIAMPEQLSVTGFDDSIIARQTFPTLTTVRQPTRDMANQAARMLVEARRSGATEASRLFTLDHEIVIRNSTAKPRN